MGLTYEDIRLSIHLGLKSTSLIQCLSNEISNSVGNVFIQLLDYFNENVT